MFRGKLTRSYSAPKLEIIQESINESTETEYGLISTQNTTPDRKSSRRSRRDSLKLRYQLLEKESENEELKQRI